MRAVETANTAKIEQLGGTEFAVDNDDGPIRIAMSGKRLERAV